MYRLFALSCLAALNFCASPAPAPIAIGAPEPSAPERPNIVYILADDMGYSDLGCYGGEITTPNLDRLAAGGLKFRHFYNAARCCPTRASLLTGQYPHAAGMGRMVSGLDSIPEPGPYQGYLREDVPTLAERLRESGYRTYMSGKWHVGERPEYWPLRRGFERYFGLISGASSYYTIRTDQNRTRQMVLDSLPWTPPAEGFYATDAYSDYAVEVVKEHMESRDTSPFFLYLAYTAPHWPLHAPEEITARYEGAYAAGWDRLRRARFARQLELGLIDERYELPPLEEDVPDWETTDPALQWERRMEVYAAMVDRMDEGIGRLIDELDAAGQLENTLIVFLSDNGGCAEEISGRKLDLPESTIGLAGSYVAYRKPWSQLSNVPFRKYKQWTDEGGIATPLIVHWPAGIAERGEWVDAYAHVIDLFPTALAVAGGHAGANVPGKNLLQTAQTDPTIQDRPLFWEHFGRAAVRRGRWKLVRHSPEQEWMLFDLREDPTELRDVAGENGEVVGELGRLYEVWAVEVGV
jgi:arylsulfatase